MAPTPHYRCESHCPGTDVVQQRYPTKAKSTPWVEPSNPLTHPAGEGRKGGAQEFIRANTITRTGSSEPAKRKEFIAPKVKP